MSTDRKPLLVALATLAAALATPLDAAHAQGAAPPVPASSTFGNWTLSAAPGGGLQIANQRSPDAIRLVLSHDCNGWFLLETRAGQFIMWTAGGFSPDSFAFSPGKPDASAPPLQAGSLYDFGVWHLQVTAAEVLIRHDANPHAIVLPHASDGWIEVRGTRTRGNLRLNPGDNLAALYP